MEKNNPINFILNDLVSKDLITAAYIEKRTQEEREIYLHIVSKKEKFNEIDTAIDSISLDIPGIIYYKSFKEYVYFKN